MSVLYGEKNISNDYSLNDFPDERKILDDGFREMEIDVWSATDRICVYNGIYKIISSTEKSVTFIDEHFKRHVICVAAGSIIIDEK